MSSPEEIRSAGRLPRCGFTWILEVPLGSPCNSKLWVVGTPLNEASKLEAGAIACLKAVRLAIGESKKLTDFYLRQSGATPESPIRFHLDGIQDRALRELRDALTALAKTGGDAALFSDCGMPVLFDPGAEVIEHCRKLGFQIRSVPGATSWATACAVSTFPPPFWVEGFLPQQSDARQKALEKLRTLDANIVLLDTPYRFRKLCEELRQIFGTQREFFLAWEIASSKERYFWGKADELQSYCDKNSLEKGEFILVLSRSLSRPR